VDAFFSQYLTLTGSGVPDNSVLKCLIGFNVGVSTDIMNELYKLVGELSNLMARVFSKMNSMIRNILDKIICGPLEMLNSFLKTQQLVMPTTCELPKINLGNTLEVAISNLLNVTSAKNVVYNTYSKELVKYQIIVDAMPTKAIQFQNSLCATPQTTNFVGSAMLNISGGALSNPLSALNSPIG
jgi:hypothetical protein